LMADSRLVAAWRERLSAIDGFRIGINWRGSNLRESHRNRDIPLALFASLADIPAVRLISLQKGAGREKFAAASAVDLGDEIDTANGAFVDTAAIMMNLDLVITCDTSVAHLAGALGVPVWVALPFVPDWRWLLDRSDSPWYPTMRLFRQQTPADWDGVFKEITAALRLQIADHR
jgi:ADP-heptose:LPS heptosyltransferase